jgi:hypothetical protein
VPVLDAQRKAPRRRVEADVEDPFDSRRAPLFWAGIWNASSGGRSSTLGGEGGEDEVSLFFGRQGRRGQARGVAKAAGRQGADVDAKVEALFA